MILICDVAGTGKSFTIEGGDEEENRGLIPRSSEEIFSCIPQYHYNPIYIYIYVCVCVFNCIADIKNTASLNDRFLVRVSFLEIYNEKISDLLVRLTQLSRQYN